MILLYFKRFLKFKCKANRPKIQNLKFNNRKKECFIANLLNPKNDYVFKRIFGRIGNEDITASLISAIIGKKITNVELDNNTILEKDLFDDKVGILDIRAKIDSSINCNIEMQIVDRNNIEKRMMFYWSKMFSRSVKSGNDYSELEKTIVILISDYELESLKKFRNISQNGKSEKKNTVRSY